MPIPSETIPPRPLLRDTVLWRLRDAIVDGTFAPDEQLRDGELAAWLGVSRTPVREALLELSRAGLVHSVPGRSTVVSPIDPDAVRDAQAVVGALHALAVRTAGPHLTPADLDAMRAANARFRRARADGDLDAAQSADADFHAVPLERSGNAAARAVIAQYEPVLHRVERMRFGSAEGDESAARHDDLIALCAAGDIDAAATLAEETWQSLRLEAPTIDLTTAVTDTTEGSPA